MEINLENFSKKKNIFSILDNVHNLPSIPIVLTEVNRMLADSNASASDLGEIISKDQGLTTKILKIANSPLYGIPRQVSTIDFAIVILGFNHIKNIVIALSMIEAFNGIDGKCFNQKQYWQHSLLTGIISKRLADDLGYHFSGEAFTAGFLHDLGIPLIFNFFKDEYIKILDLLETSTTPVEVIEMEILGATHEDVGKYLIERWNLPTSLSAVVETHHSPMKYEEFHELAAVVHLADFMLDKKQIGSFIWDKNFKFERKVIDTLKLSNEKYLEEICTKYKIIIQEQAEATIL